MPRLGPIKRNDLVSYLRRLGFEGPYAGGNHQFMIREAVTITIPNLIKVKSAETFSFAYLGRLESIVKSGRNSRDIRSEAARDTEWAQKDSTETAELTSN